MGLRSSTLEEDCVLRVGVIDGSVLRPRDQAQRIDAAERISANVTVKIHSAAKSNRIRLRIPPQPSGTIGDIVVLLIPLPMSSPVPAQGSVADVPFERGRAFVDVAKGLMLDSADRQRWRRPLARAEAAPRKPRRHFACHPLLYYRTLCCDHSVARKRATSPPTMIAETALGHGQGPMSVAWPSIQV